MKNEYATPAHALVGLPVGANLASLLASRKHQTLYAG
jgi:hypothetical protein